MKKSIKSKSSRKQGRKRRITEKERKALDRSISRGTFEQAKRAEQFGPHPGYVSVRLKLSIYNAMNQKEERLPHPKGLDLLFSSVEEVEDMMRLIEKTVVRWIRGEIVP